MASEHPRLFLVRHGDTEWTDTRRHTGRQDIPLNEVGEARARELGKALQRFNFRQVFTSPLQRASKTCQLAGFSNVAVEDNDLLEWDYGQLEGKTTREIKSMLPEWELFADGCDGGETRDQVAARADRFIAKSRQIPGDTLAFSSGHIIRMIAARWIDLSPPLGRVFYCRPASVGVLAYEHDTTQEPIIALWNYLVPQEGWEPLLNDFTDTTMRG